MRISLSFRSPNGTAEFLSTRPILSHGKLIAEISRSRRTINWNSLAELILREKYPRMGLRYTEDRCNETTTPWNSSFPLDFVATSVNFLITDRVVPTPLHSASTPFENHPAFFASCSKKLSSRNCVQPRLVRQSPLSPTPSSRWITSVRSASPG